jgi:putative membrane protein
VEDTLSVVPLQTTQTMVPNFRYVFKTLILGLLIPIGMFLLFSQLVWQELQSFYILIPLYIAFVGIIVFFKFKNYRLFFGDDFIIFKHGAWDVIHEIIEPYKLQGITTHQYFWHKKSDVGHVTFHTAAGDIGFKFANFTAIKKQMNVWLYKVESSSKHWM